MVSAGSHLIFQMLTCNLYNAVSRASKVTYSQDMHIGLTCSKTYDLDCEVTRRQGLKLLPLAPSTSV